MYHARSNGTRVAITVVLMFETWGRPIDDAGLFTEPMERGAPDLPTRLQTCEQSVKNFEAIFPTPLSTSGRHLNARC
jgi:hypothetical protein